MQKITVEYEDFDGNEVQEDLYFHLSVADLQEMEEWDVPLTERMVKLIKTSDGLEAFGLIRDIVDKAYGRRVDNGFVKNEEILKQFKNSLAYDEVIISFIDGTIDFSKFIENLIPKKVWKIAKASEEKNPGAIESFVKENGFDNKAADYLQKTINQKSE